jgi:hypothetical protein
MTGSPGHSGASLNDAAMVQEQDWRRHGPARARAPTVPAEEVEGPAGAGVLLNGMYCCVTCFLVHLFYIVWVASARCSYRAHTTRLQVFIGMCAPV